MHINFYCNYNKVLRYTRQFYHYQYQMLYLWWCRDTQQTGRRRRHNLRKHENESMEISPPQTNLPLPPFFSTQPAKLIRLIMMISLYCAKNSIRAHLPFHTTPYFYCYDYYHKCESFRTRRAGGGRRMEKWLDLTTRLKLIPARTGLRWTMPPPVRLRPLKPRKWVTLEVCPAAPAPPPPPTVPLSLTLSQKGQNMGWRQ